MLYDKDIREPLFDYLEEEYGKVRIFEEKNMGKSRADVVMVGTDFVMGIEIKSDADSYQRLERQVKDYDKYFDMNYVVVGSTHARHISEHVPEYWGILSVEETLEDAPAPDIYLIRKASKNPNKDMMKKIRLLWRMELAHIQEICGLYKYSEKSKDFVRDYVVKSVSEDRLNLLISDELFERDYSTIADRIKKYRQVKNPNKKVRKKKVRYRKKGRA